MSNNETRFRVINKQSGKDNFYSNDKIADFLYVHLDQFGDKKSDIKKCLDYVFEKGGLVLLATENEKIIGAVITNETSMSGYIPENILVYIAVHQDHRGKGLGKTLMKKIFESVKGDVALHVEPDNPAKLLYEKVGMTNKYLEMRLIR